MLRRRGEDDCAFRLMANDEGRLLGLVGDLDRLAETVATSRYVVERTVATDR